MIVRKVCRAVLLTPDREVLLMRIREPGTGWTAWITPGGGREDGEGPEDALRRELMEETGLDDFDPGPHLWHRDHTASWEGRPTRQIEDYFLIRISRFEPDFSHQPEAVENRAFQGFHWWPIEEIEASEETFVPRRLGRLLRDLWENGCPPTPVVTGVWSGPLLAPVRRGGSARGRAPGSGRTPPGSPGTSPAGRRGR